MTIAVHAALGLLLAITVQAVGADSAKSKKQIRLGSVQDLTLGVVKKNEVTRLFGRPNEVTQLANASRHSDGGELWEYLEKGRTRLSVFFTSGTRVADAWTWEVFEGDAEVELKTAMKQFPGASWQGETGKWINPHAFPTECFYKDRKLGVSIKYNEFRKEVDSISRYDPARELAAATDDGKPPKFCIGGACADAISAKEWAKLGPTCPLPE